MKSSETVAMERTSNTAQEKIKKKNVKHKYLLLILKHAASCMLCYASVFNAQTYMSTLHLRKSSGLLVYPCGQPSWSGGAVPHTTESLVDNPSSPKDQEQATVVSVCTSACECRCLMELKAIKITNTSLSQDRMG